MKKVLVMGLLFVMSGATVTMAQTKKPMKRKADSTYTSKDSMSMSSDSTWKSKKKTMKRTKPVKDSVMK